jgi:hypothetical protein
MTTTDVSRSGLWAVLVGTALLAASLQAVNLWHLANRFGCDPVRLTCPGPEVPWVTSDTDTYMEVAREMLDLGVLRASYLRRTPGYPLLLATSITLFGQPFAALWIAPLLAAAAGMGVSWTAWALGRRLGAAALAGTLFCAWPNDYQYSPLLMTDSVHGYLAVIAFSVTVAWRRRPRASLGWLAAGAWMATQSVRPTFLLLPILLPVLLWHRHASRAYARVSFAIWVASGIMPLSIVASNLVNHGMPIVSIVEPETLACYAIPRMKEAMGLGTFTEIRAVAWEHYGAVADLKVRVAMQRQETWEFLQAHPLDALRSLGGELTSQLFAPLHPWYVRNLEPLYPAWLTPPGFAIRVYWIFAAVGLVAVARQQPNVAFFLLISFVAVMAPATTSHWVGARLRFPLDLLFMPVVAALLPSLVARRRWMADAVVRRPGAVHW